jgi:ketosteroid isomerase-like protein
MENAMSIAENKELVRGFFDDIAKGNIQGALNRMAEDLRFTLIGTTKLSGVCNSRKEFVDRIMAPLGAQLEGALTITIDNLIADGDFVVVQSHGKSATRNGVAYNNTYCQIFRISDGKIREAIEYLDTELVTRAFG